MCVCKLWATLFHVLPPGPGLRTLGALVSAVLAAPAVCARGQRACSPASTWQCPCWRLLYTRASFTAAGLIQGSMLAYLISSD
jgi:hypothetical protein